jgi:AcrR family transcriptional regulator
MGIHERHRRDREAMRRRILDAARELFVREGFQHVSIRKIASRIEYSPAAIYSYFPNKDEIFFSLAEDGFRLFREAMHADDGAGDPLEALRRRFWRYYVFSKEQPEYFSLIFVDRTVPRISRDWERFSFVRESREHAFALIERGMARGLFPAHTNVAAAFHVLASAVHGAAVIRLGERFCPQAEADALARDAIEVAIAGLRAGVSLTFTSSFCPHAEALSAQPDAAAPVPAADRSNAAPRLPEEIVR